MTPWFHHTTWLGNTAYHWIAAGIGALLGYIIVYGAARLLAARLKALSAGHPQNMPLQITAAVVAATRGWVLLLLAIAIALRWLEFDAAVEGYLNWVAGALVGIQIAFWVSTLIVTWLKRATPDGSMQKSNPIIYGILTWIVELLVWVTLLLILLSNAGVHIGAFVASLGVGGIAIAMAAKNVLEDLFASIAIGLDKPFEVGEFIAFGSELGTVKKVGIKSTRIDSLSGEEMAISNANLLQMLVHNYSRRKERRIVFGFHVPLDTAREKVSQIAGLVNGIIKGEAMARLDRGHFLAIEQEGFRYEFVYYVLSPDFGPYADVQQTINLKIMAEMEKLGVPFAVPTRAIHTREIAGDASA